MASKIIIPDERPVFTGGAPRRIPVVGGPLDGLKLPHSDSGRAHMAVVVEPTEPTDPPLWLKYRYQDGSWRFIGWMDGNKRALSAGMFGAIEEDRKDQLDRIRSLASDTKQSTDPVEFEG